MNNISDLVEVLRAIENDLRMPLWLSLIVQCLSGLLGSIIGAWSAIYASSRLSNINKEERKSNLYTSIYEEIRHINLMIKAIADQARREDYIKTSVFDNVNRFCPIYLGSSPQIGFLDKNSGELIVKFYSQLLTIQPQQAEGAGAHQYLIANLQTLIDNAELALKSIQSQIQQS